LIATLAIVCRLTLPRHAIYDRLECDKQPNARHCQFDLRRLLGRTPRQAELLADEHGLQLRVVERDRQALAITSDFVTHRVDVATESGIVTEIRRIG
jgi:hypothetical protein